LAQLGDDERGRQRERKSKEKLETKQRDEKEAGPLPIGSVQSALCLILLTGLASVAVAAMFGVCRVLCRFNFPFWRGGKRKRTPFPPTPPPLPPLLGEKGGGDVQERGGTEVVGAAPRADLKY